MAILLYCPLHAITTLAAKSSQRRKKSTGRAQSLGWLCVYHRDIVSEQLEALARTNPPKKDIQRTRSPTKEIHHGCAVPPNAK